MSAPIDDGGPAFPMQVNSANGNYNYGGMSLRDWFAGQALNGVTTTANGLGSLDELSRKEIMMKCAEIVYEFADAMLAARKETK